MKKKEATTVTISSKGQITLPKALREKYHLTQGEEALVLPAQDGILVKHKELSLRGILAGKIDTEGFEKDIRMLRKEWTL
ncbi:MAG: AbrB/MazE/SpoVT family DNA-binding domain-containing protein [Thermoplasmata archaeon]